MNKISIIIPIYNTTDFLNDCIESVLSQTYQNIEVLMIDDNSNEECRKRIKEITELDSRLKSFHFSERKGVGFSRNFGVEESSGDYVYFLDSDDFIAKDAIELLIRNINGYKLATGKQKRWLSKKESIIEETDRKFNEESLSNNEEESILYKKKKVKLFKNRSILHRLISKEFIKEQNLRFSEEVKHHSDLEFIVPALNNLEEGILLVKDSIYYKRVRNDPFNNPSLNQLDSIDKIGDFLYIYSNLRKKLSFNNKGAKYLDNLYLNYYRKQITIFFRKESNIDSVFELLRETANLVDTDVLKNKKFILRREIKTLRKGNKKQFKSQVNSHNKLRQIKNMLRSKNKFYIGLYRLIFTNMPIKDKTVVLESFLGKNYSDNPKYLYEYMIKNMPDYNYVWILNDVGSNSIPGNPIIVRRQSLRYYYYLARAKYWISNSRMPNYLNKRNETVYLQTWHGTPLKKLAIDMDEVNMPGTNTVKYKRNFVREAKKWDYLISPNSYSSIIFRRAFQFQQEMLELGYPRNDLLSAPNKQELGRGLKKKLDIPIDKKVILYAPTWRDNEFFERGKYKFSLNLDLAQMRESLGNDYIILLRMHYLIANELDISNFEGFAYDFSKYEDITHLYLVSDILITDYSSVFFDYANLRRPILFYTYDLDLYRNTLRGFYFDIENEAPGPLLKSTEQVLDAILNIDSLKKEYSKRYDAFFDKYCRWDDGKAAEKVVKHVFKSK
ncbi:bifunctional glycosyltransferase/CDP-glycerol:glycerophosphate glycerophosphotransferase [Sediminibacillus albus]|uniref:CDP-glycerol glycerophosphotransferase n=1 Tax=Sediminibacillus albus TaxID=407036 RepID=A0A1G8ZGM5_9BACI|nr:CDP-glycerol:glycerophosphate glycerophosphotransferase [Sediminibacillus albus]SDK14211.1 CDP-glycerol glycerophosphotransferase [Sediminibacillus albus]